MSAPGPTEFGAAHGGPRLSPAARLLQAWRQGESPDLDTFLGQIGSVSLPELAALVCADIDERWQHEQPRYAEHYLDHYRELAADPELAVDVIYAEYLARERRGPRPETGEFQQRFPQFGEVLADQIRLHWALETDDDDTLPVAGGNGQPSILFPPNLSPASHQASYEILEQIGAGGMGVVYRARQPALDRFVALKMVRMVDATNQELLARFRTEARAVASLHHPQIVQVYDFGQHDGLPYLAMELVEGGSLAARLDGTPWQPRRAAALVSKLAGAVQFAHDRQLIHRDLKPANVLVASDQGEWDVKVTDFGLARFFYDENSQQTRSGTFLGTPSYMAPEQAAGRPRDVTVAADIYSLGAILFELLSGRPPIQGESPLETLRLLLAGEPLPLRQLAPHVPRDLATIVDKCLQSDPRRRYRSAAELQADLERFLSGEPIHARRISALERGWRWARRNPSLAMALSFVALLLIGIAGVSLWYSGQLSQELARTRRAEQSERQANQSAQQRLWDAYLNEVVARNSSRQVGQKFAALEAADRARALLPALGRSEERLVQLRSAVLASIALPDLRELRRLPGQPGDTVSWVLAPSANRYVVSTRDGKIHGYRLTDGKPLWTADHIYSRLITSDSGTLLGAMGQHGTSLWRATDQGLVALWAADDVIRVSLSPDERHAATCDSAGRLRLIEASTGNLVRELGQGPAISDFAFHPGTRRLAVCTPENLLVISQDTGEVEQKLPPPTVGEPVLAWHPSGEYLAAWATSDRISLWNVRSGNLVKAFAHLGVPSLLCFNAAGTLLASHSLWDQRLLVWDVNAAKQALDVPGFSCLACARDTTGGILLLGNDGNRPVLSELSPGMGRSLAQSFDAPVGYWLAAKVSPEGRVIMLTGREGIELWDLQSCRQLAAWPLGYCEVSFDAAGGILFGCEQGVFRCPRRVESRPMAAGAERSAGEQQSGGLLYHYGPPEQLAGRMVPYSFSADDRGETIVLELDQDNGWQVLHVGQPNTTKPFDPPDDPRKTTVSPDGRWVALANWEAGGTTIWNSQSGELVARLASGPHGIVQFSPDGRLLAATPLGVTLWQTSDWKQSAGLEATGTTPTGLGIVFSPDSRVLVVAQSNGILRFVDSTTGRDWARLTRPNPIMASVLAFSPDQRYLFSSSVDARSQPPMVWDLAAMNYELARRDLAWPADVLQQSGQPLEGPLTVQIDPGPLSRPVAAETSR